MSLSSTTNRIAYTGDGSSTIFAFPYYFFNQVDLQVYLYDTLGKTITTQVLNTNFTISGTPNTQGIYPSGGSVVFTSSIVSTSQVVIVRNPSPVQNFVLQQNATIPSTSLTQQFDYLTLISQYLTDHVTRSVRLKNGYAPTFDPTLPSSITSSAGKCLVINSSATGFDFNDLTSNSSAALLVANNLSDVLSTTTAFKNISPMTTFGDVLYAGSAAIGTRLAAGTVGNVLSTNGPGVAPSWISVSAGSSVSYAVNQYGLVVSASSASFLSVIPPVASTVFPLISGGTSANPAFGLLSVAGGGTGSSGFVANAVLIGNGTAALTPVLPGASGTALISNGSSAPSFQAIAVTTSVVSKTANYNATTSDNVILVSSSGYSVNLFGAAGNTGRQITMIKTDTTAGNIALSGSSASIQGSSVLLTAQYDQVTVVDDGTNWQITSIRKAPTKSVLTSGVSYTPPNGCRMIKVTVTGGGGGGGGCASGASTAGAGGGGGGGGTAIKWITTPAASYTYTIGAGGQGGTAGANAGQSGSSSVFASTIIGGGGTGGNGGTNSAGPVINAGGVLGGTGTGGDLNMIGGAGLAGLIFSQGSAVSGSGGASFFTGNSPSNQGGSSTGNLGNLYGGGGTGGVQISGGGSQTGGAGASGIILIEEYYV